MQQQEYQVTHGADSTPADRRYHCAMFDVDPPDPVLVYRNYLGDQPRSTSDT